MSDSEVLIQNGQGAFAINLDYEGTGDPSCQLTTTPAVAWISWDAANKQIAVNPPASGLVDGAVYSYSLQCSNECGSDSATGSLRVGVCEPGTITLPDDIGGDDCTAAVAAITYDDYIGGPQSNKDGLVIDSGGELNLSFDQYISATGVSIDSGCVTVAQWNAADEPSKALSFSVPAGCSDTSFAATLTNSCGNFTISGTVEGGSACTAAPTKVTYESFGNTVEPIDAQALTIPGSGDLLLCFDQPVDPALAVASNACITIAQWDEGSIPENCLRVSANGCTDATWSITIANICGTMAIAGSHEAAVVNGPCPSYDSGDNSIPGTTAAQSPLTFTENVTSVRVQSALNQNNTNPVTVDGFSVTADGTPTIQIQTNSAQPGWVVLELNGDANCVHGLNII